MASRVCTSSEKWAKAAWRRTERVVEGGMAESGNNVEHAVSYKVDARMRNEIWAKLVSQVQMSAQISSS